MMRRVIGTVGIAGLLLAIGLLNPISAPGKAHGTDRPFKGTGSGTVTLNVKTGMLEGDISGTASLVGRYSIHVEGSGTFAPDQTFSGTGTVSLVAADGDEISGTMTFKTSAFTEEGHTATLAVTITAGTGRFADATGTVTVFNRLTVQAFDGETLVQHAQSSFTGRVGY